MTLVAYSSMGSTKALKSFIVTKGCFLKVIPIFFFRFIEALIALSFRSFNSVVISSDGVTVKPKYLYHLLVSSLSVSKWISRLICRPPLLKITTFVFLILRVTPFFVAYEFNAYSMLFSPASDLDNRSKSSAHIKRLSFYELLKMPFE